MGNDEKKSIYKKWWFWTIVIVILLLVGNGSFKQGVKDGINQSMDNKIEENSGFNNTVNKVDEDIISDNSTISTTNTSLSNNCKLVFGELQSFVISPDTTKKSCIIKAKIEPSYSNKTTIHQNFYNIEDFIKNQNGNGYDEIQYWAVAEMQSGEESKVISFTLNKKTIEDLYNNKIAANKLDNYLDDFWVIESLK